MKINNHVVILVLVNYLVDMIAKRFVTFQVNAIKVKSSS
jgi:hypothetical protein